ncbi:hypothetical protein BDP27DRAFT_162619 [Rhodocollybia butyracea]|uniref:Uncharacterized protein n=1 Tax=Rhodocollybia butyracea TaxID=206335 RepID=A0A9P5U310_9AGAR|nr:hypothetical protein BDP27DRAFT_162619 [Rhodocollybia butyracea]
MGKTLLLVCQRTLRLEGQGTIRIRSQRTHDIWVERLQNQWLLYSTHVLDTSLFFHAESNLTGCQLTLRWCSYSKKEKKKNCCKPTAGSARCSLLFCIALTRLMTYSRCPYANSSPSSILVLTHHGNVVLTEVSMCLYCYNSDWIDLLARMLQYELTRLIRLWTSIRAAYQWYSIQVRLHVVDKQ